ncbi:hypothetical protein D3C78_1709320 [compost metagenome]
MHTIRGDARRWPDQVEGVASRVKPPLIIAVGLWQGLGLGGNKEVRSSVLFRLFSCEEAEGCLIPVVQQRR